MAPADDSAARADSRAQPGALFGEHPDASLRVVSLGGGVQSSAMLLMGAQGRFGTPPDVALFADTGNEPPTVYDMVGWLADHSGIEVITVANPITIVESCVNGTDRRGRQFGPPIPTFTVDRDTGKRGMSRRLCTEDYKLAPISKAVRDRLGLTKGHRPPTGTVVEMWIGLSSDEVQRMKPGRPAWKPNRWPLVEAGLTRADCARWWEQNAPSGAPPLARSACVICPMHSPREWASIADRHPDLLEEAAAVEAAINDREEERRSNGTSGGANIDRYLHPRRIPLLEAVAADRAAAGAQPSLFDSASAAGECEGACFT